MPDEITISTPTALTALESLALPIARRLDELERDKRRYLIEQSPFTQALWLALLKPAGDVMRAHMSLRSLMEGAATAQPSDEPGERDPNAVPAIQAVAEAMVAKAMAGDGKAADMIADRIEGKPGNRKGDVDPELARRSAEMAGLIEGVVRGMTQVAINRPGDDAVEVPVVRDTPLL